MTTAHDRYIDAIAEADRLRAELAALREHAWAVVDALYPGDRTDVLTVEAAVAALSGHLNDSGAPR